VNNPYTNPVPAEADTDTWELQASCRQIDPELWFPEREDSDTSGVIRMARAAKQVCAHCPVQTECLTAALTNDERFGIWGGVNMRQIDPQERRRLRREHNVHTMFPPPKVMPWPEHGTEAAAARHRRRGERPCGLCLAAANRASRTRRFENGDN
jgi:WhiB family redox-sensing transcriptional regulator